MIDQKQSETIHYVGHRQRLRQRFLAGGAEALADYELLEIILFPAKPRGDVKPLAKALVRKFGTFGKVLTADPSALRDVDDVGDAAVSAIKVVHVAMQRLLKEEVEERPVIQSWTALLDYCRLSMGHNTIEQFRILFLNQKNMLIADEVQQTGTVDHTPVYPREVIKRALELGAAAIILVHNHPSGDPSPSRADIEITKQIIRAASAVNIEIHDHLVISESSHYSFKSHGLI